MCRGEPRPLFLSARSLYSKYHRCQAFAILDEVVASGQFLLFGGFYSAIYKLQYILLIFRTCTNSTLPHVCVCQPLPPRCPYPRLIGSTRRCLHTGRIRDSLRFNPFLCGSTFFLKQGSACVANQAPTKSGIIEANDNISLINSS